MFEKFVVQLLDQYLTDYIENFDHKKLNIDVWNGNVELKDLRFKRNALDDLNLPVTIKFGYLQKLTLQIPWKNLYTHPTKLTIDGLYIVLIPKIEIEYDAQQDENDRYISKMKEVIKIEKLHQYKEDLENNNEIKPTNDNFSARMKLQIVQNLELSIHNIHIVYEDRTTKPNYPFRFGITLNSMTFHTTNKQWEPTIMKENSPFIHKLGNLNALAIYWNTNIKDSSTDMIKNLRATIAVNNHELPNNMDYIIRPLNVQAKLIMTLKPRQQKFEKPRFYLTVNLENISLHLNRDQYLDILDLLEYQDHLATRLKNIKYRSKKFNHPIEKWKFAYNAIVNEKIRPRSEVYKWKNIKMHLDVRREYKDLYYKEIIGKQNDKENKRAEDLERKLDIFNLVYIRRNAQIEAKKKTQDKPKSFMGRFSIRGKKKSKENQPEFDLEKAFSEEEKKDFYQTIGYDDEDTSTLTYPKEYIDIDLTIRLNMLDLNIWSKLNENDPQLHLITRATLPDTELVFKRRPATSSVLFLIDFGSFRVFGNSLDLDHPMLIQPAPSNNSKLLHAEFEINPLNKDSDYRIQLIAQSLEIKYNAPTINKLIQFFEQNAQHNLQGVKQAAYMTYTDVKQQSKLLMESNIEKSKNLDIYIDLQSPYIILPENGVYYDGCPVICIDMGHFVFRQENNKEESIEHYTQFRLELTNFQILYTNKNENWQTAREEENSRLHLIKPITLYTNIFQCIYPDNIDFPAWKISGQIPTVDIRISDTRLYNMLQHIQTLSLGESKKSIEQKDELWLTQPTGTEIYQTVENLIKQNQEQITQIEANFEISKINLLLEEEKDNEIYPFLRITFISINTQFLLKTFDTQLQISLENLIIYHEQFITHDNHQLRFLTAQYEENRTNKKKLISINILHTSSDNPKYNGIENKIQIHFSKLILTLQLEALLSIMRFQDNIMQKWPKENNKLKGIVEEPPEDDQKMTTIEKFITKKNLSAATTTLEIEADLEEFRIVIATIDQQMFDVYVEGVRVDMHHKTDQTSINLTLTDFSILDPNTDAQYQKIISQQYGGNELLSVSMILFNYPKQHTKALNDVDCHIKINFAKANIIFLYKYIDQLMDFLDTLDISMASLKISSEQAEALQEQVQKLQNQAFKLRLNAIFNAPTILIPINSSSHEALYLDLGRLVFQTNFSDTPKTSLIEQQKISVTNVLASRVILNKKNEIQSEIMLLECANLNIDINRLLHSEKVKNEPSISISMALDLIHFRLAKDDYLCLMKILTENFNDQTITKVNREQYRYRQEYQKQEEEALRNAVIKKQKEKKVTEVIETIKIRAEIKKLALTLYLGESTLINRRVRHNEKFELATVEINQFEVIYRRFSNLSYEVVTRVKNFLCDDLREAHKTDAVIHVMNRHFTVDPDAYMLVASLEYKPIDGTHSLAQRSLAIRLKSVYLCIKLDYLMILQDFFMSNLPEIRSNKQIAEKDDTASNVNIDTRVEMLIENPEIILLEDQHNSNSDCLVLHLNVNMHVINVGCDTKIFGVIDNLIIYSSNFADLRYSKIKYQILQPTKVDATIIVDNEQQKINVRLSKIIVNIAPAAVRILLGVANSLGKPQLITKQEKFDIETMFNPKAISEANFWFLKKDEIDDMPTKKKSPAKKTIFQEFFLTLKTIEIKLDVGFDIITKTVAAMCLSDMTVDLKNWSNEMTLSATMDIEAALYNEHTLAWEPFIEPTLDKTKRCLLPWNIVCSIKPILKNSDHYEMWNKNDKQKPKEMTGLNAKQLITVESGHLLNITLTKTGLDLIKHLSRLFDDLYKQRLVKSIEDNNPILSLLNATGQDLVINNLSGLEFAENSLWTLKKLKQNESVVFNALSERISSSYRLSMVEQQSNKNRQEFSLQIFNHNKLISINRTWQHIYNLEKSFHSSYPIQILSDTQIHHNQRRVILSSIIKIFNNAILPIIILDLDSITGKSYHRIEVNKEFYVPMDLLYKTSNSSIFIGVDEIDEAGDVSDFFVFDWITGKTQEQKLQLKNGQTIDLIVYKEVKEAYSENSDQLDRASYCIYIHSAIQLTNLLPIDVQCSINNLEKISLQPSQVRKVTSGDKNALLKFTIPSYNNTRWVSDPIDLRKRKKNDSNEQIITFRSDQQILRMVLHLEMFQESYRLAVYVPFWITNHTDFKLDFRVENELISIKNTDKTFLFCPEKYKIDAKGKGDIRLYTSTKDDKPTNWSEKFSVDVIKSTGMAGCERSNHKTYMVCVDITTSSFGLTKIITFSPAMVIINQTSIPIEVVETIMGKRQNEWIPVERDGIIPFWPRNTKDSLMCVRYAHNHMRSKPFLMNKKHQTLLYMNDRERLVIFVEVIATDFDGVRIIFSDYKSGDAPLLLINYTVNQIISFVQKDETSVQYLVPEQFVYYTWRDPVKPRELIVACDGKPTNIELNPHRSTLDTNSKFNIVHYVVFIDGLQTILLFSDNQDIVETTLNIPLSTQSICRRLQISIPNFGLSIVNDIKREELLYISLNKSKLLWVQMKKSRIKPFPNDVHRGLENLYNENRQLLDAYPNDQNLRRIKYNLKDYREVTFQGDTAELIDLKGRPKLAKRQSLAGLWIEYTWSTTNAALYARINRLQIDNQLDSTNFPTMLYPVLPKTSNADIVEKPFIELSIYKSQTAQSDVMHIHYCKLLIQEFSFRIDQNFILAILSFIKEDKILMTSIINMDKDLEYIHKSLRNMIKKQIGTSSSGTQMYFDHIHLSPLQIHISFSMYKSRANEDLFNEYPLVGFLLKAFNVGAVQDVILRLGYYERSFTRYTMTKLQNEILSHYQNQFLKQIHVLIFGLDVLGNPLGIIRGLAEGVESLFYEPYKGAIEGPIEFAEGLATGVLSFVGSTVGSAAGAVSRITGVIGTSLASLTFNDEYQASRIRDRERTNSAVTDIAMGGKNAVMGFVDGITGVVAEPVKGAAREGAAGFFKGVGRGIIGLVARPVGGIVDFASTSLNAVERTTTQEQIVHRIRYPRYVGRDGLVRPYISHEARGLYIFNRLEDGKYAKIESYVAHIGCTDDPPRWLMASGKRILFIVETLIGDYDIHWTIKYTELQQIPSILPDRQAIQFLLKTPPNGSASQKNRFNGRLVDYRDIGDARYLVEKVTNVMHGMGL